MDIFDGPDWFTITFDLVFIIGPSLFLVGFALAVWFLVGSRRAWAAVAAWQGSPLFPRTASQEHGTRRRIIWSIRGFALGSAVATVVMALVVGLALPIFDEIRGGFHPYEEWFTTGFPVVGATIGACLAARLRGKRPDIQARQKLGEYIPHWLTAISVASVGVVMAALAIVWTTTTINVVGSGAGISAVMAVSSLGIFLLGWRPLLNRPAGGLSAGWADVARTTALWLLAMLPAVFSLVTARALLHLVAYSDGPVTTPLTAIASLLALATALVPQAVLLVALFVAPLYVAKQRHPDRYAAIRLEWRSGRQFRRAARASNGSRA